MSSNARRAGFPRLTRWFVLVCPFLPCATGFAQPPTRSDAVACVSCVVLQVTAAAVPALSGLPPGALDGMTIVVDVADVAEPATAMDRIRAAGALPGIVVDTTGRAQIPAGVAAAAVIVLTNVDMSEDGIFRARSLATAARAAAPRIRVLLAARTMPDRLSGYVDGRVEPGSSVRGASPEALVELSLGSLASTPLLVPLEDVDVGVLAAFGGRRALSAEVSADAPLGVREIVARHQAQRRRQERLVRRTIARGTTSLTFEVPGFAAPVSVTARTTVFAQPGLIELEQRDVRLNGASIAAGGGTSPPRLPIVDAARVATPPLVISLDDRYVYELSARVDLDRSAAYVVAFDGPEASGRAWIDAGSFALRRLETVQADLQGPIVSSEQHDEFAPFTTGAETVWLPVRTTVFQVYEGAGHRTPIHRVLETGSYEIDPADFDTQLRAAYDSPHLMLRDTPLGFRYLLRGDDEGSGRAGEGRRVDPRAGQQIRTAVAGLLVDPNITVPIPFAGFSYVDLDFLGTGGQLNAFFGGAFGQLSWSMPSLGGTRWQAHGRVFAIGPRFNDRSFRDGVEQYAENITQRPAHLSAGLLRPLTPRLRMRLSYELDYTSFDRAETTATGFVVPADALVHGLVAAIDAASGPWTARVWWNPAVRQHWRPWGFGVGSTAPGKGVEVADARAFQRLGASASRTMTVGRQWNSRIELAWMDGVDLDRFSRYSFNAFDNRLQGYPTASIRYDRGAVARSSTGWSGRGFRVNLLGDVAVIRDPGFGGVRRAYPGIGTAIEAGGPLRTLWSVEWGYGFRARNADGGIGTHAIRVTVYRTF